VLTNVGVWSPDSKWIVYDVRSDAEGAMFGGDRIEAVQVKTGGVRVLYRAKNGARCGVVTHHPVEPKVVFILGPEHPTPEYSYGPARREGVIVDTRRSGIATNLDARDLTPPYTRGALRGGTHVHVFTPDGQWVSFTYDDDVLSRFISSSPDHDINQRNIGVAVPDAGPVCVGRGHPRNHDGDYFSVLVTRTTSVPRRGSDDITRAFEEAWIGTNGYRCPDGSRQRRAIAFQGIVVTPEGREISEVFLVDLPDDLTVPGDGPLEGTPTRRPFPPRGVVQRRLTFTADRPFPGIQGPRHWLHSAPDGSRIAFLMKDDTGIVQLWTVPPTGGQPTQVTRNAWPIASAFTWSPDGRCIAHVMDASVCVTDVATGTTRRLTAPSDPPPRPEACVFSPDGRSIAFVRLTKESEREWNQVFVMSLPNDM
jgi:hypothetical protein